ncbi:MAG: ABC transporter substrate-binding protein, partial [Candidatus Peregrinibacteria bacterium]
KIIPALALSWGTVTPEVWEFKLRRGVFFHDQTIFNAKSVVESFQEARALGGELRPYLNTIDSMEAVDDYTIQVRTHASDPLLLSRLTKFYISRPDHVGTGPYKIQDEQSSDVLKLTVFTDYWGLRPAYRDVTYTVMEGQVERRIDFENGKIDILASVLRDQALELPQEQLKNNFGLEVNFLMFKMDDALMGQRHVREAVRTLFDPAKIEAIGNYFVRSASQFVAPGVFGYNPAIPLFEFDEAKVPKNLFGSRLERMTLDYLETYETLSEYLIERLEAAGFSVKPNPLPPQELLDRIRRNESQVFLVGWQAEDGDAGGFLDTFIHSQGEFNGGRYKNETVDALIEASRQELDPTQRLAMLQEIMLKIDEDIIGVPLFESSRIYAVKHDISWAPRMDGLVLAAEVE